MQSALITASLPCFYHMQFLTRFLTTPITPKSSSKTSRESCASQPKTDTSWGEGANWSTSQRWAQIGCAFMSKCVSFLMSGIEFDIKVFVLTNTLLPRQMLVGFSFFFFPLNLKDRRDNRCWKAFLSYSLHCKMMHLLYLQADISALSWILHAEKCRGVPWLVHLRGH